MVPGVLLVDAISQTAALAIVTMPDLKSKIIYLDSIQESKFYKQARPGSVLLIDTEIIKYSRGVGRCKGVCKVKDETVCDAELTFVVPDVLNQYNVRKNQ